MDPKEVIGNLRQALAVSPENVPLRKYLASMLLGQGTYDEAEREYKTALQYAPPRAGPQAGPGQSLLRPAKVRRRPGGGRTAAAPEP